eukprot:TRINITY_DN22639_c0_g1_i1.p4 TRINITY_DN22639_c0_g1~~TRINITY_DN22639_c0_g1_i1.p4  ORF type:complete len:117 (-),score=3.27 TRINITY_DN22639_c0_g1_i1:1372-1722(-)
MVLEKLNKVVFIYSPLSKNVSQIKSLVNTLCSKQEQSKNPNCQLLVDLRDSAKVVGQLEVTFTNQKKESFDFGSLSANDIMESISERCEQITNIETLEKAKFDYKNIKIHSTYGFS